MPVVSLLHTSGIHVGTFERLLKGAVPDLRVRHAVREDWLREARENGLSEPLAREVGAHLRRVAAAADAVVCTCSSLGPLADDAARAYPNIVRADRPMMRAAARTEGTTLVALCLESTRAPTLEMLRDAYAEVGRTDDIDVLDCGEAWPLFEAGDIARFGEAIAAAARPRLAVAANPGCLVLAQPSMAAAETFLRDVDVPVLSSPTLAARAALALIGR